MEKLIPAVYTIPPDLGFADTLAQGLLQETDGDPLKLAQYLILLPNRRAARSLREAFLRQAGEKPMLLPRMRTVDEADEDELTFGGLELPPAINALERTLLLSKMVAARQPDGIPPEQAIQLATELGRLLDSLHIEHIDFDRLKNLVPDDLALHWQETLTFLDIVFEHWPAVLKAKGQIDHQQRVNLILTEQAKAWQTLPPQTPIIAAGSTGTRPATAQLLKVVMGLPHGRIILPGLDQELDEMAWNALDEVHPQYGMRRLLEHLQVARSKVKPFAPSQSQRAQFLSEIMRPASTTQHWRDLNALSHFKDDGSIKGITRLDLPSPRDEAGVIALILRDTLETPGRTAALVTPDRNLAARVRTELMRWDIHIDDSAGQPVGMTEPGSFLILLNRAVREALSPHALLSLLKHPLSSLSLDSQPYHNHLKTLEIKVLRGPRPAPGLDGLRQAAQPFASLEGFVEQLAFCLAPLLSLFDRPQVPLLELVTTHLECAEVLATTPQTPGCLRVWADEAGEVLAEFARELTAAAPIMGDIDPAHYPALFEQLLAPQVVRPKWGAHPRLFIWGPIEARLQRTDVMILSGLNEGTWPPSPNPDPWMSRPMRQSLGLPTDERRIGLSAHDFCQGLGATQVYLTRALRVDGTPTTPARWLLRMDTVLHAIKLELSGSPEQWHHWFKGLDHPDALIPPVRPAPKPPLKARPRKLSVTAIETWMRDPYAIYARYILGLKALDPIDADPGAAEYGTLVHETLQLFLQRHPGPLPPNALEVFLEVGKEVFATILNRPAVQAFWWPRLERVARWVIAQEQARRPLIAHSHCEIQGELILPLPGGDFCLQARADRIDVLKDGTLAIIDYKTGKPPGAKEIAAGYSPQLPLEAAIARYGGFAGIKGSPLSQLLFWHLKGGEEGGIETKAGDDPTALGEDALHGLKALVTVFDDLNTPYEARPYGAMAPKYSDYGHLARIAEWSVADDSGGEP